jgi:hypothetical protein
MMHFTRLESRELASWVSKPTHNSPESAAASFRINSLFLALALHSSW